jgi:ADP-heptose:LPS heptosyltransferase
VAAAAETRDLPAGTHKVAVFRALQLGDLLCVVPALRALRHALPKAHITLIGLPWAAQFAQRFQHYIDDFLAFPGFPGLPETAPRLEALPRFIAAAQQRGFDLLLQLHGSGALSNPLCAALGAKHYAGFRQAGGWCPEPAGFETWEEGEHEITRYLRLLNRLGIAEQGRDLEFPLDGADYRKLCCDNPGLPPRHAYACIHPGAQLPSRRWPPERFAEVADHLAAAGLTVVLTGTAQEADITGAVKREMTMPALDLTGNTELGGLAALIAEARILVCNDTGVSHIAAALGTPSVVICSGADPRRCR